MATRRKALLIGINYTGTENALKGCHQDVLNMIQFLTSRGFSNDPHSMVVLADNREGMYYPTGVNILAAMDWLVSEPGYSLFLHYSGHGGQVRDPDGDRESGYDSTIVPVDYKTMGQLDSDTLHKRLISKMAQGCQLHVIFDCCHSGSAIELPYVYRTDEYGNVSLIDNVKTGIQLTTSAMHLVQGGFNMNKIQDAKQLLAGASSLFKALTHKPTEEGVGEEHFVEDWKSEHKRAFMYSGCKDDQTSADAAIGGGHVGAMSWAFLKVFGEAQGQNLSYLQVLQQTRALLQGKYTQVPQLSMGYEMDLNQPFAI